ncbi:MAG: signal peptidase I [Flavobacteriales bacterium]|nr:signal peptidase I [Flavobacteriales bacterium]MBK9286926.1 signal peptidase I [Flavobacteriales bacterium]MBL0034976.1 signal peptidase I [Flavobacteriales bacterium]
MELLQNIHHQLYNLFGDALYYGLALLAVVAIMAQWKLYEKAGQPGIAAIVPVWNFIVFLKIVGRPASHLWLFFIPVFGQLYMLPKVWIEIAQSFGKTTMMDYVLVILFNGIYILNLGLSYDTRYMGPVHGKPMAPPPARPLKPRPSLA